MSSDVVDLCSWPGCGFATAVGDRCLDHRPIGAAVGPLHLTDDDIVALRHQVARDAAPLFVAAMAYILSRTIGQLDPAISVQLLGHQQQPELAAGNRQADTVARTGGYV